MFSQKYSLEIVSQHSEFRDRPLKKYGIDGIDTVGAWGNEPFEIRFKNNTYQKVEVKLSVDGTDILTGAPATTDASGQMWLVNAYGTLNIKAWPESQNGGAALVFTSADKSVALNTHGDISNRGIIAAAIFVEGHQEPVRVEHHHHYLHDSWSGTKSFRRRGGSASDGDQRLGDSLCRGITSKCANPISESSNTLDFCDCDDANTFSSNSISSNSIECNTSAPELKSLASVGAGSFTNQHISYVKGFIKPVFTEAVRVKYVWWDDLKVRLEQTGAENMHPTGFPGDHPQKMISLGSTPRIDTAPKGVFKRAASGEQFYRF